MLGLKHIARTRRVGRAPACPVQLHSRTITVQLLVHDGSHPILFFVIPGCLSSGTCEMTVLIQSYFAVISQFSPSIGVFSVFFGVFRFFFAEFTVNSLFFRCEGCFSTPRKRSFFRCLFAAFSAFSPGFRRGAPRAVLCLTFA